MLPWKAACETKFDIFYFYICTLFNPFYDSIAKSGIIFSPNFIELVSLFATFEKIYKWQITLCIIFLTK
jgi:hypothetical protein